MGDAFGEVGIKQDAGDGLMREGKVDFRFRECGAVSHVGLDGMFERGKSPWRVVKIGNGIVQTRRGQIGEHLLELAEGLGSLKRLIRRTDRVVAAGALDEFIGAPIIPFGVGVPCTAVARGDESEHAAVSIRLAVDLRAEMGGDALDIFHDRDGVFEDVMVDALDDVARCFAGGAKDGAIGIVDVPAAVGCGRRELAGNFKVARHLGDVVVEVHGQSLSG